MELAKYKAAFAEAFGLNKDEITNWTELTIENVADWDSVGHMSLIACLEEQFDIMMEAEDIISIDSFEKGIEILKKYDIQIAEE